ncbi:MAG TPA: 2Fe-2S iron-sulfur cluster-binding protein [Candidatus Polarisedimenticolaceae bacterium]
MPKVVIDGKEIEVAAGTTILQAALSEGSEIPHYCWHEGLSVAGNCRMCLVEVEKAPKLVIGCYTPVADGMVVHTQSEKVKQARAAMMEFFLINHPLDCPICDQAGECKLQDYAVEHGTGVSRYTEPKLALNKAVDIGRHVMLDQERCIQCSRCIRFCDEITKTGELAFFQRGERSQIGIVPGRRLDNAYSGNVVDLCPVGALTLKEFRFQTRVWYLKNTPTVCAGCSRGCNVVVGVGQQQTLMTTRGQMDDRVKRIVARSNEAVNGPWICDEGRLSYQPGAAAKRLDAAESPAGTACDWDAAIEKAAGLLKAAAAKGALAIVASPRLTTEDLFAWRKLAQGLGGATFAVRRLVRGEDDRLLLRADKGANATGAEWLLGDTAESAVLDKAARGEVQALLVLGDNLDPADTLALDPGVRARIGAIVFAGAFVSGTAESATVLLPTTAWAEEDGTIVNFEGRIQRVRRARTPWGESRPGWKVAAELAQAAGAAILPWTRFEQVLDALAAEVAPYAGLDADAIGLLGTAPASAGAGA